jgi:hypothetical protein
MKRFANSLRLRVANRVKAVILPPAIIADAIASGVMQFNADNVGVTYQSDKPFFQAHFILIIRLELILP